MGTDILLHRLFGMAGYEAPEEPQPPPEEYYGWRFPDFEDDPDFPKDQGRGNFIVTATYKIHSAVPPDAEGARWYKEELGGRVFSYLERTHELYAAYDRGLWRLYEVMEADIRFKDSILIDSGLVRDKKADFKTLPELLAAMREWDYRVIAARHAQSSDTKLLTTEDNIELAFLSHDHWSQVADRYDITLPPLNRSIDLSKPALK